MPFPTSIVHPSGAKLSLVPDKVLVKVPQAEGARALANAADPLAELGLEPLTLEPPRGAAESPVAGGLPDVDPHAEVNNSDGLVFTRTSDGRKFKPENTAIAAGEGPSWVAPVYAADFSGTTEYLSPLADAVVLPAAVGDDAEQARVLEEYGLVRDDARSEWLGEFDVYRVTAGHPPAFEIRDDLSKKLGTEVKLEFIPMVVPVAMQPNDPLFSSQWDMVQIGVGGSGTTGWDLQRGASSVIVAILDEGVDLNHPDLAGQFAGSGINLGTMSGTGAPTGNHGTPCAGIAAAPVNNGTGTAGVAGGCRILPIAFATWSATEVAAGLRYARQQGARVVSMSFGWNGWDQSVINPAIDEAHAAGMVLVAATHNHNTLNGITYPATHPLVIAVGASDQVDNRKSPSSPDGEGWGSNYGPQISVVAPGVRCPAPDRTGSNGYTNNDYTMTFNGTSAATPHVAGLAALLISRKSSLTNVQVRDIIERTAAKVGTVPYATVAGYPNGTWNNQMGYGRIDVLGALQQVPVIPKFKWEDEVFKPLWKELDIKLIKREFDKPIHREIDIKRFVELDKIKGEIDEIKRAGREAPDLEPERFVDPVLDGLKVRLDQLERTVDRIGASFITPDARPDLD